MIISSPLEQFELIPIIPLFMGSLDISFTHSSRNMNVKISLIVGLVLTMLAIQADARWVGQTQRRNDLVARGLDGKGGEAFVVRRPPSKSADGKASEDVVARGPGKNVPRRQGKINADLVLRGSDGKIRFP